MKKVTSFRLDPDLLNSIADKVNFYGFRSVSDLVDYLLSEWDKNPKKR